MDTLDYEYFEKTYGRKVATTILSIALKFMFRAF